MKHILNRFADECRVAPVKRYLELIICAVCIIVVPNPLIGWMIADIVFPIKGIQSFQKNRFTAWLVVKLHFIWEMKGWNMSRGLRFFREGGIYHVVMRGHNRSFIFDALADKTYFLQLLKRTALREGVRVIYYVLMDNHYHLVLRQEKGSISRFMQLLNQGYSKYYNKRYQRTGTVYGKRFSDYVIKDQRYLRKLIQYIANNPVRAGIVKSAAQYKWGAHLEVISPYHSHLHLISKQTLFGLLASGIDQGRQTYLNLFRLNHKGNEYGGKSADEKGALKHLYKKRMKVQLEAVINNWRTNEDMFKALESRGEWDDALRLEVVRRCVEMGYPVNIIANCLNATARCVCQMLRVVNFGFRQCIL